MAPASVRLSRGVLAVRSVHAAIAIAYVWCCALTGRRGALLRFAVAALVAGGSRRRERRGLPRLAGLQRRVDDPVPLFELVPARAARAAVPALGAVAALGIALLGRPLR